MNLTPKEVFKKVLIEIQLNYLLDPLNKDENNKNNVYFINILDGDVSFKKMKCFKKLINKERYASVKDNIFCGDMHTFRTFRSTSNWLLFN